MSSVLSSSPEANYTSRIASPQRSRRHSESRGRTSSTGAPGKRRGGSSEISHQRDKSPQTSRESPENDDGINPQAAATSTGIDHRVLEQDSAGSTPAQELPSNGPKPSNPGQGGTSATKIDTALPSKTKNLEPLPSGIEPPFKKKKLSTGSGRGQSQEEGRTVIDLAGEDFEEEYLAISEGDDSFDEDDGLEEGEAYVQSFFRMFGD